jgi:hypothetical protein
VNGAMGVIMAGAVVDERGFAAWRVGVACTCVGTGVFAGGGALCGLRRDKTRKTTANKTTKPMMIGRELRISGNSNNQAATIDNARQYRRVFSVAQHQRQGILGLVVLEFMPVVRPYGGGKWTSINCGVAPSMLARMVLSSTMTLFSLAAPDMICREYAFGEESITSRNRESRACKSKWGVASADNLSTLQHPIVVQGRRGLPTARRLAFAIATRCAFAAAFDVEERGFATFGADVTDGALGNGQGKLLVMRGFLTDGG